MKNRVAGKMLVASSFNSSKKDFRNPFLRGVGTFGNADGKVTSKMFEREFAGEFIGRHSPAPTKYDAAKSDFSTRLHESKT